MKRHTYYRGIPGVKWGIWNRQKKQYQFDISEDTPMLAEARLFQLIGDDARKWKFEAKRLNGSERRCRHDESDKSGSATQDLQYPA